MAESDPTIEPSEAEGVNPEEFAAMMDFLDAFNDNNGMGSDADNPADERRRAITETAVPATGDLANALPGDNPPVTPEQLNALSDATVKRGREITGDASGDVVNTETPNTIEDADADALNARLRPFLELAARRYGDFVESRLPKSKLAEYRKLQNAMKDAVDKKNSGDFDTARAAMDKFIDDNFDDIKNDMRRKMDEPPDPKKWEVMKVILEIAKLAGIIGALAWFFSKNDGCWMWEGGAKSRKLEWADFSKKPDLCACSADDNLVSKGKKCPKPTPKKGKPNYPPCPPNEELGCTVRDGSKINEDGIFYSYYVTSPLGEWNNVVNQSHKLSKGAGEGLLTIARWSILIGSLLAAMFLAYQGVQKKSGAISYYIMSGILLLVGILGYWYIGTQIK